MSEYKYSISGNITGQAVNIQRLHNEISGNLVLGNALFRGVVTKQDDLYVLFTENIETAEKSTLDLIIENHTDVFVPAKTKYVSFYPTTNNVSNDFYTSLGCFIFPGAPLTTITEIEMLSMMSPGATSYSVQIVNRSNNTIIAEQTFTNTSIASLSFTTLNETNIPTYQTAIEVLVKITKTGAASNKVVHIDQVVCWLD